MIDKDNARARKGLQTAQAALPSVAAVPPTAPEAAPSGRPRLRPLRRRQALRLRPPRQLRRRALYRRPDDRQPDTRAGIPEPRGCNAATGSVIACGRARHRRADATALAAEQRRSPSPRRPRPRPARRPRRPSPAPSTPAAAPATAAPTTPPAPSTPVATPAKPPINVDPALKSQIDQLVNKRDFKQALEVLERAIQAAPNHAGLHNLRGTVHGSANQVDKALAISSVPSRLSRNSLMRS